MFLQTIDERNWEFLIDCVFLCYQDEPACNGGRGRRRERRRRRRRRRRRKKVIVSTVGSLEVVMHSTLDSVSL